MTHLINKVILIILISVLFSCSSKNSTDTSNNSIETTSNETNVLKNNSNTSLQVNDAEVEFNLPKGFDLLKEEFHASEWVADIAQTYSYKNSEEVIFSINYEKLFTEPYFYNEFGRDDVMFNDEKLRLDGIMLLAISNANGNGISSWNKKEITTIGGRSCIYVDFEAREKRNVSVIWLTDSLYFIELFYQSPLDVNNNQLDSILESIRITQND